MPWDAKSFRARHNKALSQAQAGRAATIANAVLTKTGDEGKAIRIANARAKMRHKRSAAKTMYPRQP